MKKHTKKDYSFYLSTKNYVSVEDAISFIEKLKNQ